MVKGKKGWIRIVEAFVAILLIAGILLIIAGEDFVQKEDESQEVYGVQTGILRDIQVNDLMRADILAVSETQIKTGDGGFPSSVQNKIDSKTPSYLECESHICDIATACSASNLPSKDIYVQSAFISDPAGGNNKLLKLFCWIK